MTDLTQRALELADTFANGMFAGHAELYREELGTLLRAAMREALEEATNAEDQLVAGKNCGLGSNGRWTAYVQGRRDATLAIRALIDTLARVAPIHAVNCNISEKLSDVCSCGASDSPDPRDAEIERLLGIVKTMDEALEDAEDFGLHIPNNADDHDKQRIQLADDKITNAREAARQTLDCDLADK